MISLKIHWFDLLAVQGTLGSLLKHHSLKVPVLRCSIFFPVQLSQLYMTRGKTIALTIPTFVGRGMFLLLNTLSRFVIAFLSRSNRLISWLQITICSDLRAQEKEICHYSTCPHSICHEVMGLDDMISIFLIFSFKLALSLSFFTFIKRLFSSSSLSAIRVVSSAYLRLLIILLPILITACNSSSPASLMMCSVYRLNKQGDSRQPCFLILNQSVVPYRVLTVAS